MSALRFVQDEKGWISTDDMADVASYLGMPKIAVYEVATFYHMYNLKPMGKHVITVCTNLSCTLGGAEDTVAYLQDKLGIGFDEMIRRRQVWFARRRVHGRMQGCTVVHAEQQKALRPPDQGEDRHDSGGAGQIMRMPEIIRGPVTQTTMDFDQPWTLENYLKVGGYQALRKVLTDEDGTGLHHRRGQAVGVARPRRRGLPHRAEVEFHAEELHRRQIYHLQFR